MKKERKKWYFNIIKEYVTDVPTDKDDKFIGEIQRLTAAVYCTRHNFQLIQKS